jgi:hypothetical protein
MAMLHGRRIVVGMTASGIAPRLLTPTTREFWMSGSEYQANIASMLLQHKQIEVLPRLAARHQRGAGGAVRDPARPAPAVAGGAVFAAASAAAELVAVAHR